MIKDFLYQVVDIPDRGQIDAEVCAFYEETPVSVAFHIVNVGETLNKLPTMRHWFAKNNLVVQTIALINMKPGQIQSIHVDYSDSDIALNYPVKGCSTSVTRFYKNKGVTTIRYTPKTNLPFYEYSDDSPEKIGEYSLTDPVILHIKTPHSVKNHGPENRVCLSFRFKDDPWFMINGSSN